ncbi:hypothetical protein [Streptomyces sp. NPDC126514]|uniref:SCO4225 family membrane protein n=1 Tax=Streptomyces sp. NPDC126514 TaxID=3155210 RepID=UPI00332B7CA0
MTHEPNGAAAGAAKIADNWISRGYLALVAATLAWVVLDAAWGQQADGTFAAVWPLLLTAPVSLLATALPLVEGATGLALYGVVVLGAALINAYVIGAVVRRIRRSRPASA